MLNNRLLQPIIDGKKIIIMVFSNRKQEATQNLGFVVKNIVNVALLKNKIIIRVELANFYQFSSRSIINPTSLFITINLSHQQV